MWSPSRFSIDSPEQGRASVRNPWPYADQGYSISQISPMILQWRLHLPTRQLSKAHRLPLWSPLVLPNLVLPNLVLPKVRFEVLPGRRFSPRDCPFPLLHSDQVLHWRHRSDSVAGYVIRKNVLCLTTGGDFRRTMNRSGCPGLSGSPMTICCGPGRAVSGHPILHFSGRVPSPDL